MTIPKVKQSQMSPANGAYYRLFSSITARMLNTPDREKIPEKDPLHTSLAELLQSNTSSAASYDIHVLNEELSAKHTALCTAAKTISAVFSLESAVSSKDKGKKTKKYFSDIQMKAEELRSAEENQEKAISTWNAGTGGNSVGKDLK